MKLILAILISLVFFITSCVTLSAEEKCKPCPESDMWISAELIMNGKSLGKQKLFVPKGDFGESCESCPNEDSEVMVPVMKNGRLVGYGKVIIPKGHFNKTKTIPKPKKNHRVPADNIRTWHCKQ